MSSRGDDTEVNRGRVHLREGRGSIIWITKFCTLQILQTGTVLARVFTHFLDTSRPVGGGIVKAMTSPHSEQSFSEPSKPLRSLPSFAATAADLFRICQHLERQLSSVSLP